MHISILRPHPTDRTNITGKFTFDSLHDPNAYTSEGSEFLDDAIRMKDQPLQFTQDCITAGSPEGLL